MSMNIRVKSVLALSTALGTVALIPTAAQAQQSEARASTSIQDIVVTARRVEERLQDVPISVTVFNQDQITARGITNTNDLATYTPSLGQSNVLGNLQATFSLRGFNQELSTSPTVGVIFADVVAPRGASNQQQVGDGAGPGSFFDLANVQVLKGPQGTLFGRNTTGGAILIVPQKPTGNFGGYVEGSYGNYDMYRVQAVLNLPLSESARLRLGLDRQKRDGYVKNLSAIGPKAFNDVDYWAARASLVVDLSPNLESYTIGTYTHSKAAGEANNLYQTQVSTANPFNALTQNFGWLAQRALELRPANAGFFVTENAQPNPRTQLDEFRLINTTTWRATDTLTIKNITSYAEMKYDLLNPVLGVALPMDQLNASGTALIPVLSNAAAVGAPLAGAVNQILAGLNLPTGTNWTLAGAYSLLLAASGRFSPANIRPGLTYPTGATQPFTNSNPNGVGHTADQWTFTEELQFQGQALESRLTWQAGFYFEKSGPLGNSGSATANAAVQPNAANAFSVQNPYYGFGSIGYNDVRKNIRTMGIYSQASYDLTEQLKLTGGLRYTWDKQTATGALRTYGMPFNVDNLYQTYQLNPAAGFACTVAAPTITVANNCQQTNGQTSKAPTWLIGLDFKPTQDLLLYGKYARGYRTGGINLQLPVEYQKYDKEKVNSYEVGVKASLEGAIKGTFNVAGFYNEFSNQQVPVGFQPLDPRFSNQTGVINAGKSRIYGVEVDTALELFRGFVVSAGYSYLNTKIKEIAIPNFNNGVYRTDGTLSPRVGDRLSFSPDHKFTGTVAYTLPLAESAGDLTVSATYTYTGERVSTYRQRDAAGNLDGYSLLKPYELWDFNLVWKRAAGSPIDVSAFVNNAFQEKYFTYILDVGQNFQMAQLGQARTYGLRVKYNFGD